MNMAPDIDIQALASLSRVALTDEEAKLLLGEVRGILAFVETIQRVSLAEEKEAHGVRNVMRTDADAYEKGVFSEALLDAAPKRRGDHVVVKQVLSHVKKDASRKNTA